LNFVVLGRYYDASGFAEARVRECTHASSVREL